MRPRFSQVILKQVLGYALRTLRIWRALLKNAQGGRPGTNRDNPETHCAEDTYRRTDQGRIGTHALPRCRRCLVIPLNLVVPIQEDSPPIHKNRPGTSRDTRTRNGVAEISSFYEMSSSTMATTITTKIPKRRQDDPNYERDRKRRYREKAKQQGRVSIPRVIPRVKLDKKMMPVTPLSELVRSLLQKDVTTWHFELSKQLDVYTSVTFKTNDMIMKEKQAGGVLKVTSESELCRSYQIFFRGTPWLEVKKSSLSNAGYGLFVARPEGFKCHEVVGINYGKIIKGPPSCNTSEYAFVWKGIHGDQPATYIDAQCGVKSGRRKGSKAYFAIHMANDPSYQK